jgi:hypothetical protein
MGGPHVGSLNGEEVRPVWNEKFGRETVAIRRGIARESYEVRKTVERRSRSGNVEPRGCLLA